MSQVIGRNPHAGEPFTDTDSEIAAALEVVSVPALLCSLVHMTGDPSWIRGDIRPRAAIPNDRQCGIPADEQADVRSRAVEVIAAYRDGGCNPHELSNSVLFEMMEFLATKPVTDRLAGLFFDDLELDGRDPGDVTWSGEIAADVKAASPVVVIGCGMGGILAGIRLQQAGLPFVIVEKNPGPGGTWWENRYPGARVDVGSHSYSFPFEPGDSWSEYYCQQPELCEYFTAVLDKHGLRESCRFDTTAKELRWDEQNSEWEIELVGPEGSTDHLRARFVISAVGSLNFPRMPDIPNMDSFTGPSFHSIRWPDDLDLHGRRVALIGAGASGFQIGPPVAEQAEHLTIFQRTAQWITPNPIYHSEVPAGERWALRHLPLYGRWYRFMTTYPGIALGVEMYRIDPNHDDPSHHSINAIHAQRAAVVRTWMESLIEDRPDLYPKVIPDYPALGKRILQDDGSWLKAMKRPDVELVRTTIDHIEPDGVVTVDGNFYPADVICYATGFRHNDFLASMEVIGRDGVNVREQWGDEPTAYLGITIPNFPNLFCVYGPGTNLAHSSSLFYHAEFQVHYAMEAIHQTLLAGARSCEVTAAAHDAYKEHYSDEIGQLIWSHHTIAHSHYKNPAGKVFTLSPWPIDLYREMTLKMVLGDYSFS